MQPCDVILDSQGLGGKQLGIVNKDGFFEEENLASLGHGFVLPSKNNA